MRVGLAILLLCIPSLAKSEAIPKDFSITLQRIGCVGTCPDYKITIFGSGLVVYEGKADVAVNGRRKGTISLSFVRDLVRKLKEENVFAWEQTNMVCVDYPEISIAIIFGGKTKRLLEGCQQPGKVMNLAGYIDKLSNAQHWVGTAH